MDNVNEHNQEALNRDRVDVFLNAIRDSASINNREALLRTIDGIPQNLINDILSNAIRDSALSNNREARARIVSVIPRDLEEDIFSNAISVSALSNNREELQMIEEVIPERIEEKMYQIRGVFQYGLTMEQVKDESYNQDIFRTMDALHKDSPTLEGSSLYEIAMNMETYQIQGVLKCKLTREQVENKKYNHDILKTMDILHEAIPSLEGSSLYETAMNDILPYQLRGVLKHELTLSQVGIGISNNNFEQKAPDDLNFSEKTINALESIKEQNPKITPKEAYSIAIKLSLHQILGLVDFGLSLKQVNTQQYKDLGDSLRVDLIEKVLKHEREDTESEEEPEIDFPLSEKQQEIARKELDNLLNNNVDLSLMTQTRSIESSNENSDSGKKLLQKPTTETSNKKGNKLKF